MSKLNSIKSFDIKTTDESGMLCFNGSVLANHYEDAFVKALSINEGKAVDRFSEGSDVYYLGALKPRKSSYPIYKVVVDSYTILNQRREIIVIAKDIDLAISIAWKVFDKETDLKGSELKTLYIASAEDFGGFFY